MYWLIFFCCFSFVSSAFGYFTYDEYLRRIQAHLTINDPKTALIEASEAFRLFPQDSSMHHTYILCLAKSHLISEAIAAYKTLEEENSTLLEEIAWSILEKGQFSGQYAIRVHALVGAYFAQDRRSVQMLLHMMRDTNAVLRCVAIQLASYYRDELLQDALVGLLYQENSWLVRCELIKAVGKIRIKKTAGYLEGLLEKNSSTFEEKELAIKALVDMHEDIAIEKLQLLVQSPKACMRKLASVFIRQFEKKEAKKLLLPLIADSKAEVRIAALQAFVALMDSSSVEEKKALVSALNDVDPAVAITAAWATALFDETLGIAYLEEALLSASSQKRVLASAAVAALGEKGTALAKKYLEKVFDPFVRLHLAIALIGQRVYLEKAQDTLYLFFIQKQALLQYGRFRNTPFFVFQKSEVPFLPQVPNYPLVMDEVAQLQLLSFLAVLQDPRATKAMELFLSKKTWGISSLASSLLMQEGDDASLDLILTLLESTNESVQLQAAIVLAHLGKEEQAQSALEKCYYNASCQNKKQILEALGKIAKPKSAAFFLEAFEEPFEILRICAAASMLQCLQR